MDRITAADLDTTFGRVVRAAQTAGLDTEGWSLEHGSVTYGRAWRLYRRQANGGLCQIGWGDSYLGSNRRECERTLRGMVTAFELIEWAATVKPS